MSSAMPANGFKIGYARVSTADQNESLQLDALKAAGCEKVFTDKASGKLAERPGLAALMQQLRPGDTVVVWRLDRLGRSLRHLIDVVADIESRGVGFKSLTESIDTTTPGGKLIFHVFGALAEFERELIRERTKAGLDAARARVVSEVGQPYGRPRSCVPLASFAPAAATSAPSPGSLVSAGPPSTAHYRTVHSPLPRD